MKSQQKLSLWDIFCIATGAMISSGLFILPAIAFGYGRASIIVAYLVAGILMIPSIFSKAELLTAMPKTGGMYFFIERSFGPFLGIFGGLASWFSLSLKSAFALVGIGAFLKYFFPGAEYIHIRLVAAAFCIIFVIVNILSLKVSARLQNMMVIFLLLTCLLYVILGFMRVKGANYIPFWKDFRSFFSVVGLVFISYGGLTKVATLAEDTHNPSKTIPAGMFLSWAVVQIVYVLCVSVTIGLLGKAVAGTLTPLTEGALRLGGVGLGVLLSLAAMTAFITTANAGILSSSRVPVAMSRDDLLPRRFSSVSRRHNTPYFSIVFTGIFMLSLILFLDLENLVKTASTLKIILFMFANLAVIIMRESRIINYRPSFRSPFYPWMQIFAVVVYSFLIFEMGRLPLIISFAFVGTSLLWFLISAPKLKRQSALMHWVERVTDRELVDTSLEEELKEIIHHRDAVIKDRFDHLIERCPVLDIKEKLSRDEFFERVAAVLAPRLSLDSREIKRLLIKREEESHTVIEKGLAIPHIVVPGENKFEVVLVRAQEGIVFSAEEEPVHSIFVLAGTRDERNFHLRALMAIANTVREHDFYESFMRARDAAMLRIIVLSSPRKRLKRPFCLPETEPKEDG